jgi:hypothetical protein
MASQKPKETSLKFKPTWLIVAISLFLTSAVSAQEGLIDRGMGVLFKDYQGHVMSQPIGVAGDGNLRVEVLVYSITAGGALDIVRLPSTAESQRLHPGVFLKIPNRSIQQGIEEGIRMINVTGRGWRTDRGVPKLSEALVKDNTVLIVWRLRNSPGVLARFYAGNESAKLVGFRPQLQEMTDALDSIEAANARQEEVEIAVEATRAVVLERDLESESLLRVCRADLGIARSVAGSILTGKIVSDSEVKMGLLTITKLGGTP